MQSHYYHLYYPDYPLKMSIGTAVEAVKEGASEPNSTEKVVKEGGILQDVGQEEVKTSTTKKNALEAEKKEDHQLRARKVEAKTNPPEQGTKEVKGLEQVTSPTDQDQEKDILKGDLYLHLWEHFALSMIFGMEQIQKLESYVAKYPAIDQLLVSLEQKTKVKKIYLLYGIVATVVTWLMFGYGAQLLCNAIGFAYPAYCSVKALESSKKDDDTQWLVYWVVFAMFSVLEFFSDILVGWVPFYWFVKCVFLVWLMSPLDGSSVIYNRVILPLFHKNQSKIDSYLNKGKGIADQAFNEAAKIAAEVESKKSE